MGRYTKREFQLGDFWLSTDGRSPAWCRTWFDKSGRQTKRASLGTTDFQEACQKLTEWYFKSQVMPKQKADDLLLDQLVLAYYHGHAVKKRSGTRIKYQLGHITDFFSGMTVTEAAKPETIERFTTKLLGEGLKASYVNNILIVIKAALNRAYKRGELNASPFIAMLPKPKAEPKGRPLKVDELAALHANAVPHIRAMIVVGIGTAARPEAVCELKWSQVDFEAGVIDLNPKGRTQTTKFRPVVKMPPALRSWLEAQPRVGDYVVQFRGKSVHRYFTGWATAKTKAKLEGTVTPYSARHSAARWMRTKGVPHWEVSAQLGHSGGKELSITEVYASHSPDYLAHASAALDELLRLVLHPAPALALAA